MIFAIEIPKFIARQSSSSMILNLSLYESQTKPYGHSIKNSLVAPSAKDPRTETDWSRSGKWSVDPCPRPWYIVGPELKSKPGTLRLTFRFELDGG